MAEALEVELKENELKPAGFKGVVYWIEEALCILSLVLMGLLPVAESVARNFFSTGVPASSGLMTHLLLMAGLIAGMICTRDGSHLYIALVQHFTGGLVKQRLQVCGDLISGFVGTVIAWSSLSFIKIGLEGRPIGFIPDRVFALIIPISYGVIAFRFFRRTGLTGWKIAFPILTFVLATVAAFPVIAKFIWGFDMPDAIFDLCDKFYIFAYYAKIPLTIFLLVAALGGAPLFVVMGALGLLLLFAAGGEMDSVAADI